MRKKDFLNVLLVIRFVVELVVIFILLYDLFDAFNIGVDGS